MSDSSNDPKLAKAEAKAAKAKAKALRPWFKKKRFIFPIILVAIIAFSIASQGGSKETGSNTNGADSSGDSSNSMPAIGAEAIDGKFAFTVTKVKCGIDSVGSSSFGAEAQGQFCLVSLNIENVGDEPQTMFADNQKVFDSEGREFSADTASMLYLEGASTWIKEINPGNTLKGELLFDVPADASLDYIELHDSMFSGGVEVSLK